FAQSPGDLFTINLPREVVVGDKILPAGVWDIRWTDSGKTPTIKLYRDNALNVEVPIMSVASEDNGKHEATEGLIEKIGSYYYLTRIWIKGERTDNKILLPSHASALQHGDSREIAAEFVSNSWFSQGARSEGQNRT